MSGKYKIESGVPVPAPYVRDKELYEALRIMSAGDSVVVPAHYAVKARSAAVVVFGKGNATTRKTGDLVRIWRRA